MKENINFFKQVFNKRGFDSLIDKEFKQLKEPILEIPPSIVEQANIEDFFTLYQKLFYQIPKEGIINSHEFLIKESNEYANIELINEEIQALSEEISSLREENLNLLKENIELKTK